MLDCLRLYCQLKKIWDDSILFPGNDITSLRILSTSLYICLSLQQQEFWSQSKNDGSKDIWGMLNKCARCCFSTDKMFWGPPLCLVFLAMYLNVIEASFTTNCIPNLVASVSISGREANMNGCLVFIFISLSMCICLKYAGNLLHRCFLTSSADFTDWQGMKKWSPELSKHLVPFLESLLGRER